MAKAFGIISTSANHIKVAGMQAHRPIGAFSFFGRYRVIDFPVSNMTNSGMDRIYVYVRERPRSLTEHLGTGRHYNINSKRGRLQIMFSEKSLVNDVYNTDIADYAENLDIISRSHYPYVIIAPSYMIFKQDFSALLDTHIESGADVTLLYHKVDNAREKFLNCDVLNLNKQKGVLSIEKNRGNTKDRSIFMDTYVMSKDLFIELVVQAQRLSSMYTLPQILNLNCENLDVRGVAHRGYFATITDFKSYYDANLSLLDLKQAQDLFDEEWPIYTRTTDSCPTQYFAGSDVHNSVIANGCLVEGTVENSVIGRCCQIKKGAVVRNSVVLANSVIGEGVHIENQVVDKWAQIIHAKEVIADPDKPGYVKRDDTL